MEHKTTAALVLALVAIVGCVSIVRADRAAPLPATGSYLFVWAGEMNLAAMYGQTDGALQGTDFLAVLDVTPAEPRYGRLVTTLPVANSAMMPHHTNYAMPADDLLFANDFDAGKTFIFDLRDPLHPRLTASFEAAGNFTHPHSYVGLPNGNTLATYQQGTNDDTAPGALVELDPAGHVVRSSAAADPRVESFIRPYSLEVVPPLDRVVSTSFDMDNKGVSHVVQVWRLSDLKLMKTIVLPHIHKNPVIATGSSEPRLLADGRTVLAGTFNCGLYRIDGLEGTNPSATLVYDFGARTCALPVVAGHFWLEALQSIHCIVSLDVSDPSNPVEVGRITLGPEDLPHWLALEPGGNRVVITGYGKLSTRILIANVDMITGKLSLDEKFREQGSDQPGFSFDRHWPDGWQGMAIPHGAVFSRPAIK
ncbi:MAG: hypothetical protein WCA98_11795 [Candidatus Acidiferrales bacterium]